VLKNKVSAQWFKPGTPPINIAIHNITEVCNYIYFSFSIGEAQPEYNDKSDKGREFSLLDRISYKSVYLAFPLINLENQYDRMDCLHTRPLPDLHSASRTRKRQFVIYDLRFAIDDLPIL